VDAVPVLPPATDFRAFIARLPFADQPLAEMVSLPVTSY
jgi:hypothetical protein